MRFLAAFVLLLPAAAETLLLRNANVHPVASAAIANGSVLVENGKIAEVGQKLAVPKGARVVDLKGLDLYPGMIDSATELGLTEISSVRETNEALFAGSLPHPPHGWVQMEREAGLEPVTSSLARRRSTTELLPHVQRSSTWARLSASSIRLRGNGPQRRAGSSIFIGRQDTRVGCQLLSHRVQAAGRWVAWAGTPARA